MISEGTQANQFNQIWLLLQPKLGESFNKTQCCYMPSAYKPRATEHTFNGTSTVVINFIILPVMLSSSSGRISDGLNDGKIIFRKYFRISGLIRQTYENAVNIAIELFFI